MMIPNKPKHLLYISDISNEEVQDLFHETHAFARDMINRKIHTHLQGYTLGNIILEPSTRTRMSFESAFQKLGGDVISMNGKESSSIEKGESIIDTLRTISGYVDVMTLRSKNEDLHELTKDIQIPIINGGNGTHEHPTQALIDVYTMEQKLGDLTGKKITLVGDLKYGRTIHSLIQLLDKMYTHLSIHCIALSDFQLPNQYQDSVCSERNNQISFDDKIESIQDSDIIYVTRTQQERLPEDIQNISELTRFQVNKQVLDSYCPEHVCVLHPLPRNSAQETCELSHDLDEDDRLAIFQQAHNGIPLRMALFKKMLVG